MWPPNQLFWQVNQSESANFWSCPTSLLKAWVLILVLTGSDRKKAEEAKMAKDKMSDLYNWLTDAFPFFTRQIAPVCETYFGNQIKNDVGMEGKRAPLTLIDIAQKFNSNTQQCYKHARKSKVTSFAGSSNSASSSMSGQDTCKPFDRKTTEMKENFNTSFASADYQCLWWVTETQSSARRIYHFGRHSWPDPQLVSSKWSH